MLPSTKETDIPGLKVFQLDTHSDNRGWFKENWRASATSDLDKAFVPIQNNVSFNSEKGVTRGLHAEPWDKYVSVANGSVFGAWVDLRAGETFGAVYTTVITPDKAVFVPAGVANGFQALENETTYVYLVNGYWNADAKYVFVNLFDPKLNIPWPIPADQSIASTKDLDHPNLSEVAPFNSPAYVILGKSGQVGRELTQALGSSISLGRDQYDLSSMTSVLPTADLQPAWVINAAAFTKVDFAESAEGSLGAWASNAIGVTRLASHCNKSGLGLVHYSTDYVFDGSKSGEYLESDGFSPLNVYGQSKAAGDLAVSTLERHYILRTSWVIGDGHNFVRTMASKALAGEAVSVVADQIGRLTFAKDLTWATEKLLTTRASYGTYNVTSSGPAASWFEIARLIYEILEVDADLVSDISSEEFDERYPGRAKRPRNSLLSLGKFEEATGSKMPDWRESLSDYLSELNLR